MTISSLPLSYCTNVHPGRTVAEVEEGLDRFTLPIKANYGSELAAGLWLSAPVIRELEATTDGVSRFVEGIRRRGLSCYTLNAFPYGDFHSARVKENVYLPDWSDLKRQDYTRACARVLASLLPVNVDGSISTVPLGFKPFEQPADFADRCADQLIDLARFLRCLRDETGRTVRLAIEPEPFCVLETTGETVAFFNRLRTRAADVGQLEAVREFIGVCYDVCHQAVEFEDIAGSIQLLSNAEIRINKVHITCAIEVSDPWENGEARRMLAQYVEPRYLHQTFARIDDNAVDGESRTLRRKLDPSVVSQVDLDAKITESPTDSFRSSSMWRVHFHVPVDAEHLGPLGTTRGELKKALAVLPELDYAPHLEVETYTWEVLPNGGTPNLVDGFSRELLATRKLIWQ